MFEDAEKRIKKGAVTYWKNGQIVGRRCTVCGIDKEISKFGFKNKKKGVYCSWCKECRKEHGKQYREANKEHLKQYREVNKERRKETHKQWCEANKEYLKKYNKQYREDNKEHIKEKHKQWYENNPNYDKQWYENNKERVKEKGKQWRENNKEHISKRAKRYSELNKESIKERHKQYYETNKRDNIIEITQILHQLNPELEGLNIKAYGNIYKITNIKTNRVYVGQTILSLNERYGSNIIKSWIEDRKRKTKQKFLDELENEEDFILTGVLDIGICKWHLDKLEAYYINKFDSCNNGYNNNAGNHDTNDGIEEFEQILKENNLKFMDGKLIKIV